MLNFILLFHVTNVFVMSQRVFSVVDWSSHVSGKGGNIVDVSSGDVTIDLSATSCNSLYCPDVFLFTGGGNTLFATMCHRMDILSGLATDSDIYVKIYTFSNFSDATVTINDGVANAASLAAIGSAGSSTTCLCMKETGESRGRLACT